MKILIDIAHPAHIHYFRNFYNEMTNLGHECLMTLRNKKIIVELAKSYNLNYEVRSSPHSKTQNKIAYALESVLNIYKISRRFKPDMFIDMGTIFASPVSKLLRKPYIAFDDTEVSVKARRLHMPFTDHILTPASFRLDLGKKHLRFNSFMELGYLHPNFYSPQKDVLKDLGVEEDEKYAVIRFVSWEAHHDVGESGISLDSKLKLIKLLEKHMKVFISAEGSLPDELQDNIMQIPVERMHDALNHSSLVITEGATMASEAALLGVPTVYYNSIFNGYSQELSRFGLLHKSPDEDDLFVKVEEILSNKNAKLTTSKLKDKLITEKIDFTKLMVWFFSEYPKKATQDQIDSFQ